MFRLPRRENTQIPDFPIRLTLAVLSDSGILPDATYYYKVQATDSMWAHLWGSEEKGIAVTLGQKVLLTWTAVTGAGAYNVYRTTTPGSYPANSLIGSPAVPTWTDSGGSVSTGVPGSAVETLDVRDLGSLATFDCITQTTESVYDIIGLAGGVDGRVRIIFSENANSLIRIRDEHPLATATDRIRTLKFQGGSAASDSRIIFLSGNFVAGFIYDASLDGGRWVHMFSYGATDS